MNRGREGGREGTNEESTTVINTTTKFVTQHQLKNQNSKMKSNKTNE